MPFVRYSSRSMLAMAGLSFALLVGGCGDKGSGDSAQVKIKDLEMADGTINDEMTDLDGVQSEGTAIVDAGGGNASGTKTSAGATQNSAETASGGEDDTEVVADQ